MSRLSKLSPILAALCLAGCGGGHHHSTDASDASPFTGRYTGNATEATPLSGGSSETLDLTVARTGTLTGTATDTRYSGTGTVASGSTITSDGTVSLTVTFASGTSVVRAGTLSLSGTQLTGILTEANGAAGGPTFSYNLSAVASD